MAKKFISAVFAICGVTFVCFLLMVYLGPDLSLELAGKNPSKETLESIRHQLGYDRPFLLRYFDFIHQIFTFDFGISKLTSQPVSTLLIERIPTSFLLILPGFVLGNLLAVLLAIVAASNHGLLTDKLIMAISVIGMSLSFLIVMIGFQVIFSSSQGMDLFPVRGWGILQNDGAFSFVKYINHVTVPTLILIFVSMGYHTRFYRAVLVDQMNKPYVLTAQATGIKPIRIWLFTILKNALIPIFTRILFSIPFFLVGGSLLLESFFGVPGIGLVAHDAILAGEQSTIKAIVSLSAILFIIILTLSDLSYQWIDPRTLKNSKL